MSATEGPARQTGPAPQGKGGRLTSGLPTPPTPG